MIATTAAKIGRSMKKRENMVGVARLFADRDVRRAGPRRRCRCRSRPAAASSRMRSAGMPSATSASRTAVARRLASSTLAAWLPVRSAKPVTSIGFGAGLHRRREALRAAGSPRRRASPCRSRNGRPATRRAGATRGAASGDSGLGHVGRRLDRRVGREPERAVDDDLVAGREALRDEPAVAVPVADDDRPQLGLVVLVDDPDEVALGALLHRALRDEDRVRPDRAAQARAHVLVGTQHAFRIVDRRADQERAGLRVVRRVGERDLARVREQRAVDQLDLDDELAVLGQLQQALAAPRCGCAPSRSRRC